MLIDLSQAVGNYLHDVFVAKFQWWVLLGYVAQAMFTMRFVVQWSDEVEQHARTDFYRGVARVTRGVLASLAAAFDLPLPKEKAR